MVDFEVPGRHNGCIVLAIFFPFFFLLFLCCSEDLFIYRMNWEFDGEDPQFEGWHPINHPPKNSLFFPFLQ
jgi:hypothetical protein